MKKSGLQTIEILGYIVVAIILCSSIYVSYANRYYFDTSFSAEDGFIEWSTTLFLISSTVLLLGRCIKAYSYKNPLWSMGMIGFAFLFLFAAGEEISWGQRLFDVQSGNFFSEHNSQQETNLHNLMIGTKSINKIIFSQLVVMVLAFYLFVFPMLYKRFDWIHTISDRFAIPIVRMDHTIAFVIVTLGVFLIQSDRKWEVYEFCFALLFLLIFYRPKNSEIYHIDNISFRK